MEVVAAAIVSAAALKFDQANFHFGNLDSMSSFLICGSFCTI
jgi:hypothetical protein